MSRKKGWQRTRYRGSRGSAKGAVLTALIILAVLSVLGTGVWFFQSPKDPSTDLPSKELPSSELPESPYVSPEQTPEADLSPTLPPAPETVRGIYVSGPMAGSASMNSLLALVEETELNTMVIDLKNDEGHLTYQSTSGTAAEIGACMPYIQDMSGLVETLKARGIYTIARIVAFKDPVLAKAKPELALHNSNGAVISESGTLAWVNPYEKEVWAYLEELALDAAALGFDEVQFDYVRFPAGGSAQVDYSSAVHEAEKSDIVADFLREVTSLLHEKNVRSSADVFGTVITNPADAEYVGQDFTKLAHIVDKICPMLYPSHYSAGSFGLEVPDGQPYETISAALKYASSALFGIEKERVNCVRPWLQDFTATWVTGHVTYGPEELRAQIQAVYDSGYTDWLLWNAGNSYTAEGLQPAQ